MAKGRFGRRRRGESQNLTGLVLQLLREERAAKDRAMFDAYKNGGMVDGEAVTDQALLAYIKTRRDQMGAGDPLWDQWNNTLIQTQFAIGEQKIQLAFKQGRVSAGAVANFYRGQLANIPKDSQFYREVAARATEWGKSAAGSARAAARARITKQITDAEKRYGAQFDAFLGVEELVADAARRAGLISGNQDVTDANATALAELLDNGRVMGSDNTPITYSEWQMATVAAYKALGTVVTLRKQGGFDYKELTSSRDRLFEHIVNINALDDRQKYETARAQWLADAAAAQGDPYAVIEANRKYVDSLTTIRNAASSATGTAENQGDFIGGIENELRALKGEKPNGPTVADLFEGSGSGDAESTFADATLLQQNMDALAQGTAYLGQAEYGSGLQVIPYPVGAANDPFGRQGLDASVQASVEEINGVRRVVYLKGAPVQTVTYIDTATGQVVDPASVTQQAILSGAVAASDASKTVGFIFQGPSGNTSYGIVKPDGSVVFTNQDPFTNMAIIDGVPVVAVSGTMDEKGTITPNTLSGVQMPSYTTPIITAPDVSDEELLKLIDTGIVRASDSDISILRQRASANERKAIDEGRHRQTGPDAYNRPPPNATLIDRLSQIKEGTLAFTPSTYTPFTGGPPSAGTTPIAFSQEDWGQIKQAAAQLPTLEPIGGMSVPDSSQFNWGPIKAAANAAFDPFDDDDWAQIKQAADALPDLPELNTPVTPPKPRYIYRTE